MADVNNNGRVSRDDLLRLVRYEAETGLFFARVRLSSSVGPGDVLGTTDRRGYVSLRLRGRAYKAHRLAWFYVNGVWPDDGIDHADGRKSNNAISNLRPATAAQNAQNSRVSNSDSTTGLLGVRAHKGKFQAKICTDGRDEHLGTFGTPGEAHQAYVAAKRVRHEYGTL